MRRRLWKKGIVVLVLVGLAVVLVWYALLFRGIGLPVLMYHHLSEVVGNDMMVTPETFEKQLQTLIDAGYQSVTVQQLLDYVDNGTPLPSKPVLITFDDGYASNLEYAAPILKQYGQHGVIFMVGEKIDPYCQLPQLELEDALPWIQNGVLELGSHTFQMHHLLSEGADRDGMLPREGESDAEYRDAVLADLQEERDLFRDRLGMEFNCLSFPYGFYTDETVEILEQAGIRLTVTTEFGPNRIRTGAPETIQKLNRFTMTESTSAKEELRWLKWTHDSIVQWGLRELGFPAFF